ncbi:LAQU0S19e00364g1_1 [Lachancea quebecensis]|uniref:LAQU0S19e00364g1_1 n=1 Tax=Lachancea quebecensis TaxID=1654605 RepID=A0A0P1KXE2_9SACH|nr:LAQU0S19e00364g1_1 [Lachancea quebecensis]
MTFLGKAFHISFDLVLVSACLAGIKRNTGLTPKVDAIGDPHVKGYVSKYLNVGESCYDYTVATLGSSHYFVRK